MFSKDLELSISQAYQEARDKRHEYLTVEHMLLALLDNASALSILKACGADVEAIAGQPRAVRTRLIRLMHQAVLESEDSLDFDHVQHVEAMISTWKGQGPAQLPGAITARVEYGRLMFHRGSAGEMSAT